MVNTTLNFVNHNIEDTSAYNFFKKSQIEQIPSVFYETSKTGF